MNVSRTEEFMRLFLSHERRFYGLIVSMVPNLSDADDLLQDVSAAMWSKFSDYQSGTDFAAWGLTFARYAVLKHYQKSREAGRVTFSEPLLELLAQEVAAVAPQSNARQEALRECLAKLPARTRLLVELRYKPGATLRSAAESAQLSAEAAYKALNRAHEALVQCVQRVLALQERT
jgi:RNA polymerase sigma-70 factor, ECF subfamily